MVFTSRLLLLYILYFEPTATICDFVPIIVTYQCGWHTNTWYRVDISKTWTSTSTTAWNSYCRVQQPRSPTGHVVTSVVLFHTVKKVGQLDRAQPQCLYRLGRVSQDDVTWELCSLKRLVCWCSDNSSGLVASRDDGKSPRGQDWGLPGTLLRLYILYRGFAMCILDRTICYVTWLIHESYMRITGISVQPCNGREANHEDRVR